jgi:hypothetical protein
MSGGYTPLFQSLSTGTLCGKWPDIGLWPIVLSLADKHGLVDVTAAYIASVTGLGLDEVTACLKRFCEPDAYSRSTEVAGARLVLIDPEHRDWGWKVVNHGKYREKARKAAYDADRTASGQDAERKRSARAATRDNPTRPDASRAVPLSDSDTDSDTRKDSRSRTRTGPSTRKRPSLPRPGDFTLTDERRARIQNKLPDADSEALFDAFTAHHDARDNKFADWDRALDTWISNAPRLGYQKRRSNAAGVQVSQEAPHGRAASGMPYAN